MTQNKFNLLENIINDTIYNSKTIDQCENLFDPHLINTCPDEYNLLELSILSNKNEITNFLISFPNWNINHQNDTGQTILQFISDVEHFNLKIAHEILNYSQIDTEIVDSWGNNPLYTAVFNYARKKDSNKTEYLQWIKSLSQKGFLPNQRTLNIMKEFNITFPVSTTNL